MGGMRKRNLTAGAVLIVLGVVFAYLTSQLPTRAIENATDPSFFPWVITVCLLALSVSLLVQGLLPVTSNRVPSPPPIPRTRYMAALALFLVYLAALPALGFIAANIPFFAVLMILYGERRPVLVIVGSVVISGVMFFLFRQVFQIRLPAGILDAIIP